MAHQTHTLSLRSILDKVRLNGVNFIDWDRNLRIVLKQERKDYVLGGPIPPVPSRGSRDAHDKHVSDALDVGCLMLASMELDLQSQMVHLSDTPYQMMNLLKDMFQEQAQTERFKTLKELTLCQMAIGTPVGEHVLRFKGILDHLARLGIEFQKDIQASYLLGSLTPAFDQFVINYNMHSMDKTIMELHGMLQTTEKSSRVKNP